MKDLTDMLASASSLEWEDQIVGRIQRSRISVHNFDAFKPALVYERRSTSRHALNRSGLIVFGSLLGVEEIRKLQNMFKISLTRCNSLSSNPCTRMTNPTSFEFSSDPSSHTAAK